MKKVKTTLKGKYTISVLLSMLCKILYDYQIIKTLPDRYMEVLTYGLDFNATKIFIADVIFIFVSLFSHFYFFKITGNMGTCMMILFYLYYIPLSSSYYLNNESFQFLLLINVFWMILCIVCKKNDFSLPVIHKITDNDIENVYKSKLFRCSLVVVAVLCILYAYKYNGLSLTLNITNIYDARKDYIGSSSILESLLYNFGGTLFIPIAILYSLKKNRKGTLIIAILSQIAIFSIARQKGHLLIIGIVFIVYFLDKLNFISKFNLLVPYGCCGVLFLSYLECKIFSSNKIFMLLIRRMMYIPAWLNTIYYDFFFNNKLLLWSQDVFLVERLNLNRYDESILKIINDKYFMGYMSSPNTGLFAEAYMHFGIIGCVIYPLFISIVLKLLFKYASCYDRSVQLLIVISVSMSLTSLPVSSGIFCVTYLTMIIVTIFMLKVKIKR